jgi:hypothetical protein
MKVTVSAFVLLLAALVAPRLILGQELEQEPQPQMKKQQHLRATAARTCQPDGQKCSPVMTCHLCCNEARDSLGTRCGGGKWTDGTLCGLGSTCKFCTNAATYWFGKGFTACGTEPKSAAGTVCSLGTTCNTCEESATYWFSKAATACGKEPCWTSRTVCAAGTTCNMCCGSYSWKLDQFITSCD